MPFSSFIRALSQVDHQFVFTAAVWMLAILIAGFAFRKFARHA